MPQNPVEFRCLLISPSDVAQDRQELGEMVKSWNAHVGRTLGARLELIMWETHSVPEMTGAPQAVLNRQLLPNCDLAIALFWSRIGTATKNHPSGSAEEIAELRGRGVPMMVYFCTRDVPQALIDLDQLKNLRELRSAYEREGLLATYTDGRELCAHANFRVTGVVAQLLAQNAIAGSGMQLNRVVTAPTPDVRVSVANAFAVDRASSQVALMITVANHSPIPVFIASVFIEAPSFGIFALFRDHFQGAPIRIRELQPGRSFMVSVDPKELRQMGSQAKLACAAARDEIGRIYRSTGEEFERSVKITLEQYDQLSAVEPR